MKTAIAVGFVLTLSGLAVVSQASVRTIRFPGSGTTTFETDGRILYAGTGWTREEGASVFDVRDPAKMKYVSAVRARGYTTDRPVIIGNFVYQPLWFGAMLVDVADPTKPTICELLDFDFPNHTCDRIVRDGNELRFVTRTGTRIYEIVDPAKPAAFKYALPTTPSVVRAPADARQKLLPPSVRGNARFVGDIAFGFDRNRSSYRSFRVGETNATELCERFMLHSLSTLAVVGDKAYVHAATQPMTHGVWTLDLTREGYADFGGDAIFRPAPPRGTDAFTMLMQSVGSIADLGNGWLLADDGAVKLDAQGKPAFVGDRERPVCNSAIEGKRSLLAQSAQVKLIDVTNPASIREIARWTADPMTHATGVALCGNEYWAVTQERKAKGVGFLTYVPPKSTLRKFRQEGTNLVEIAQCELPPSVSCLHVRDGILYVSGISRHGENGPMPANLTVVDGRTMKVLAKRTDLTGSVYKIKRFGDRVFLSDTDVGIRELDVADVRNPRNKAVWRRTRGSNPGYDDFTVVGGKLYALAHSSLDVFSLAGGEDPDSLVWESPRFARNFGAVEKNSLLLKDGYEAVAFGEGGLVIRKNGKYVAELPSNAAKLSAISTDEIRLDGDRLFVTDRAERVVGEVDVSNPERPKLLKVELLPERMPVTVNLQAPVTTVALQTAIDEASNAGGGKVVVPCGEWTIGTVWLRDKVELNLSAGSVLKGSADLRDYNADDAYPQNWGSKGEGWSAKHLIIAHEVHDVAITGEGTIDGNAAAFMAEPDEKMRKGDFVWRHGYLNAKDREHQMRPGQGVVFIESRGIRIEGVTMRNMPMWTCFLHGCEDAKINGVKIANDLRHANTDGFDIDSCRNVTVANCNISTGDDAFAIRGAPGRLRDKTRVCENILVTNCTCACAASGVRVGVGAGAIRKVKFRDICFKEAGHGLLVQSCYPGAKYTGVAISDIQFENIRIEDSGHAVIVSAGTEQADTILENILFKNVTAKTSGCVIVEGAGKVCPRKIVFDGLDLTLVPPIRPRKEKKDWEVVGVANQLPAAVVKEKCKDVRISRMTVKRDPAVGLERQKDVLETR